MLKQDKRQQRQKSREDTAEYKENIIIEWQKYPEQPKKTRNIKI
nr:hypothetical protein [Mycoplasmopsis bovis]